MGTKKNGVKKMEEALISRSIHILGKKKISRTEEKIISNTIQLIQITHNLNFCDLDSEERER